MTAVVLDAGAFIAIERGDRRTIARLEAAQRRGLLLRTSAIVISQIWREPRGRQARLARFLRSVQIRDVDLPLSLAAGLLLGRATTSDPIDATVVLVAEHGDLILTSDPDDIAHLASTAGTRATVVPC